MHSKERKGKLLLGSSIFLSYPVGDELSTQAEKVVKCAVEGTLEAFTSSMIYDDVISGLRSKGMTFNEKLQILTAIALMPPHSSSGDPHDRNKRS